MLVITIFRMSVGHVGGEASDFLGTDRTKSRLTCTSVLATVLIPHVSSQVFHFLESHATVDTLQRLAGYLHSLGVLCHSVLFEISNKLLAHTTRFHLLMDLFDMTSKVVLSLYHFATSRAWDQFTFG